MGHHLRHPGTTNRSAEQCLLGVVFHIQETVMSQYDTSGQGGLCVLQIGQITCIISHSGLANELQVI